MCSLIPLAIVGAKDFYSTFVDLFSEFYCPTRLTTITYNTNPLHTRYNRLLDRLLLRYNSRRTTRPICPLPLLYSPTLTRNLLDPRLSANLLRLPITPALSVARDARVRRVHRRRRAFHESSMVYRARRCDAGDG